MIRYVVQHVKGVTSVQEIRCQVLTPLEDQSVAFLPRDDFKVKISEPKSLEGEVWFGWALSTAPELALAQAESDMIEEAKRNERKNGVPYEPLKVLEKVKEITVRMLK